VKNILQSLYIQGVYYLEKPRIIGELLFYTLENQEILSKQFLEFYF